VGAGSRRYTLRRMSSGVLDGPTQASLQVGFGCCCLLVIVVKEALKEPAHPQACEIYLRLGALQRVTLNNASG